MSLTVLALTWLLHHPGAVTQGAARAARPGVVDAKAMQASFADLTKGILNCYHRTARYQVADVVQAPWERQTQYGADKSAVVRITYGGMTGTQYQMYVVILGKDQAIRTAVLADSAKVPYSKACELEQWTSA